MKSMRNKDFITTQEWDKDQLEALLDLAVSLKAERRAGTLHPLLLFKTLYMLFFFSSTRTRNSFETGMTQLGGHAVFLTPDKMQLSHGESIKDTVRVLSSYGDAVAVRQCDYSVGNKVLREMSQYSSAPIINMQCDVYHPCQALADLMTIRENFEPGRRLKLGVAWTSAPNYVRPLSVPQSLILLMPRFGIDVTLAYPAEFRLQPEIEEQAARNAAAAGTDFYISHRFEEAFENADVVIPKSWGPLFFTQDEKKSLSLIDRYPSWVCDEKRMALTKDDSLYMHPLPADRGREVTDAVIDGPHSVIYQQAENRLHVQKALLAHIMGGVE
ncbi:MAG: ornithine carbamoyltransferase [Candidatus Cloacimonetes bacterium]|nr:ornithine carbamoyltransferase [Candidatus Cloacimonadota bacterium]